MTERKPRTATQRSAARYARAAATLPPITLNADQAAALAHVRRATGETTTALVRRLLLEERARTS